MSNATSPTAEGKRPPPLIVLSRTELCFDLDGAEYRVPDITRSQFDRSCALEASAESEENPHTLCKTPQTLCKTVYPIAEGVGSGRLSAETPAGSEPLRTAQLVILAEQSNPPLPVAALSPLVREQILWALVAQHFQLDPTLAAPICVALLAAAQRN